MRGRDAFCQPGVHVCAVGFEGEGVGAVEEAAVEGVGFAAAAHQGQDGEGLRPDLVGGQEAFAAAARVSAVVSEVDCGWCRGGEDVDNMADFERETAVGEVVVGALQ